MFSVDQKSAYIIFLLTMKMEKYISIWHLCFLRLVCTCIHCQNWKLAGVVHPPIDMIWNLSAQVFSTPPTVIIHIYIIYTYNYCVGLLPNEADVKSSWKFGVQDQINTRFSDGNKRFIWFWRKNPEWHQNLTKVSRDPIFLL